MFEHAAKLGWEGIISKRADAPYRSERTEAWLKIKTVQKGKFPVIGFVKDPTGVAALYLGKREGKDLVYMGKVGTGWSRTVSSKIRKQLDTVVSPKSKLTKPIRKPKATWVEPSFTAEVEFRDITSERAAAAEFVQGPATELTGFHRIFWIAASAVAGRAVCLRSRSSPRVLDGAIRSLPIAIAGSAIYQKLSAASCLCAYFRMSSGTSSRLAKNRAAPLENGGSGSMFGYLSRTISHAVCMSPRRRWLGAIHTQHKTHRADSFSYSIHRTTKPPTARPSESAIK